MTLPTSDTVVLYPAGETTATGAVLHVEPIAAGLAVLLDQTPVHPVDAGWPDQGPDEAVLVIGGDPIEVFDCIVGATDGVSLYVGSDIPVKKGTDGWAFIVVHVLPAGTAVAEGDAVQAIVDVRTRLALSIGHTACHVASLALNLALVDAWRKQPRLDAAGHPDFDATAIERSTITPNGSVDEFRIGKSVRKAGFDPEALADPAALSLEVAATLTAWIASGADVRIEREGDGLSDRREWVCDRPDGTVRIPCGGTHASSLRELGEVAISLVTDQLDTALTLRMTTRATPSA